MNSTNTLLDIERIVKERLDFYINSPLSLVKQNLHNFVYVLWMFPYPSGSLHLGHFKILVTSDTIALHNAVRHKRIVFQPVGWDSFGLPAEQKAIEEGIDPKIWTEKNILQMSNSLKQCGLSLNWDAEIKTHELQYYRHDQFIFLHMFSNGLVYRDIKSLEFCEKCNVVLSKEQSIGNRCWRCGCKVILKETSQWFIRIRDMAEYLLNFQGMEKWDNAITQSQKEWIGKENICEFKLPYKNKEIVVACSKVLFESNQNVNLFTNLIEYKDCMCTNGIKITYVPELHYAEYNFVLSNGRQIFKRSNVIYTEKIYYKLRDWNISRQRIWATPIPLAVCTKCNIYIPMSLPVTLEKAKEISVKCTNCDYSAKWIGETMDTFFSSSWYMFRYLDPLNEKLPFNPEILKTKQIDYYIGGREHNTAHMMFTRFMFLFLKSYLQQFGFISQFDTHLKCVINQGFVLADTSFCDQCNKFINNKLKTCPTCNSTQLTRTIQKMSKSKLNGDSIDALLATYSADALRLTMLFLGPVRKDIIWSSEIDGTILGMTKFLNRILNFISSNNISEAELIDSDQSLKVISLLISTDNMMENLHFNTAIANLMECFNIIESTKLNNRSILLPFILFLRQLAPLLGFYIADTFNLDIYTYNFDNFLTLYKERLKSFIAIFRNHGKTISTKKFISMGETYEKIMSKYGPSGYKLEKVEQLENKLIFQIYADD